MGFSKRSVQAYFGGVQGVGARVVMALKLATDALADRDLQETQQLVPPLERRACSR